MVLIKAARSVCIRVLKEAGTAYPSRDPEFLVGSVMLIFLVFCVVLLCVFTF